MKVLFDGYWWLNGPPSGAMVLKEMVRAWSSEYPGDHITLAVPRASKEAVQRSNPQMEVISTRLRIHPLINALELPYIARKLATDAIIAQNFSSISSKSNVFVHDAIFKTNPEWFTLSERIYLSPMLPMTRFASNLFTSTLSEKSRIERYISRSSEVRVTGLGMPNSLKLAPVPPAECHLETGAFILSVGRLNVRKNLTTTILGALESGTVTAARPLVIVGGRSGKAPNLEREITAAINEGSVILLGHVEDKNLRWLYENCSLFCYLSLDEGYGLPPVEAMSLGAKALVSDIPVFREVLGDSAGYVDPLSVEKIASAIRRSLAAKNAGPRSAPTTWKAVVDKIRTAITEKLGATE
ncbi:glycosyltransferase family 4 protein [Rhodococcus fascians]|nr:glycosyltransferase family 4 protein [Rhodococcus fascians]MBY4138171.1 glycosyltransferase family 4 protein [Rhodococcus fascians]MBY4216123.1 glycosyltransferase family 4 protein [Rhodococcus fascians]MBY4220647.1 glycosyltransferase family 4 protein [Rhodococcus fascians]MBY4230806.1 glycosyltransferase family 4 protein [Rhodococcus fascians]